MLRADEGWALVKIAAALDCSRSHVDRTLKRFKADGLCGLIDRREDNGCRKADERYIAAVRAILTKRPRDFGHRRTTWSRRLLIRQAQRRTGVTVSKTTVLMRWPDHDTGLHSPLSFKNSDWMHRT